MLLSHVIVFRAIQLEKDRYNCTCTSKNNETKTYTLKLDVKTSTCERNHKKRKQLKELLSFSKTANDIANILLATEQHNHFIC